LNRFSERTGRTEISLEVLNNLIVNHEAGAGEVGTEIAKFFASKGADASVQDQSGDEQWLIVFNPKIIASYDVVDPKKVQEALAALSQAAEQNTGNLLDLAIKAIRLRVTVGEVSDALENVYGRHRADTQKVTGVYAAAYDSAEGWEKLKGEIAEFAKQYGRRPRVMIAKVGQDGHDRGAKVVATAFADLGFDVDMGPLFQTPEECARQAIENDVHALGISTLAAGHKTLVPAIIQELRKQGADDIIVFVGGVIPRQDYEFLYESGVKGIYGPGTPIPASAKDVLEQIRKHQT
jgi:methylmalonyl-CoA mutase